MTSGIYKRTKKRSWKVKDTSNMNKDRKGKKLTQKHKDNIGEGMIGKNVGKKRTKKTKDKISKSKSGAKHPLWKGGKYQNKEGRWYVWINDIKYSRARYIAMKCLGRELTSNECIHHINEDKSDDRPKNLYVFPTNSQHMKHHGWKQTPHLISNLI